MIIEAKQKKDLEDIYQKFFNNERIQRMKLIPMHRGSNCFIHSFKVAKLAIKRALRHKIVNLEAVLVASILHDYYLYDWRVDKEKRKKHAKDHPYIAIKNAEQDFDITDDIKKIMKSHMWPINIKEFPNTKEARIVTLADKTVAFKEAMCSKNYKRKREEKYYSFISQLF